jgi:tetratricopeptide (TPR) repeat protein
MKPVPVAVRDLVKRSLVPLTLVIVIVGTAGWLGTEVVAEISFRRAQEALRSFDYAAASGHLQTCLALRPNRFQFHFAAAQTERRAGNYRQALHHLDRCQHLAGDETDISSLERTLLHAQQGAVTQVENPLWLLVEQNHPDKLLILEALAGGYLGVYSLPLADKALKMLVEEEPAHAESWFLRGGICELLGAAKEGLDFYRRALELRPDNDSYRLRLANCLLQTHRIEEALPHLEQLCRNQPDNPDVLTGLARALSHTERKDRRKELLARALAAQPHHPRALAETAKLDLDEGRFTEAQDGLQKAIQADPSDQVNQYLLFQCLERAGKKEAARQQQARWKALGKEMARLEDIVRNELPKNPRSADLYFELGAIFARQGKPERARSSYQHALTCNPNHRAALQGLARDEVKHTPHRPE